MLFQHTSHLLLLCTVAATVAHSILSENKNTRPAHVVSIKLRKEFLPKRTCANSSVETIDAVSLEQVDFGCPCESSEQCKPYGSVCKEENGNKTCGCLEGYYQAFSEIGKPMCKKNSGLGGFCAKDEHCRDPKTKCDFLWEDWGYCGCIVGYFVHWDDDHYGTCIKIKGYGVECLVENSKDECFTPNALCWTGLPAGPLKCLCHKDFYENGDNNQNQTCLQKKELEDLCAADYECRDHNSECNSGRCTCQASFLPYEGKCYKEMRVGEPCEINEQCVTPNTLCAESLEDPSNRLCQCEIGLVAPPNEYECVVGLLVGQNCSLDWVCSGNLKCSVDQVCACPPNTVPNAKQNNCLQIAIKLGDLCEVTEQCTLGKPGLLSNCSSDDSDMSKTCQCLSVALPDTFRETCLRKAVKVGDPCTTFEQCSVNLEESLCAGDTCKCFSWAVESTDSSKCLLPANLDDTCRDHNQCQANAECLETSSGEKVCDCNHLSGRQDNVCWRYNQRLDTHCSIQLQCRNLNNTYCDQTCKCTAEYVPNDNSTACLPIVDQLHGTCEESSQCKVPNSDCMAEANDPQKFLCQCKTSNFVEDDNRCMEVQTYLAGSCEVSKQCSSGINEHAICYNKSCTCSTASKAYDGKCYVPSGLNEFCTMDVQCYVGVNENAFCDYASGTCMCQEGFKTENSCLPASASHKIISTSNFAIVLLTASLTMLG